MNQTIQNSAQLQELINSHKSALLYFYNDNCAPCLSLRPKIEALLNAEFPLMMLAYINAMVSPELSAEFGIFASPSLIVFFEGEETMRESKYVSLEALQQKIERYYTMIFGT
jgi:thioredoxin 1